MVVVHGGLSFELSPEGLIYAWFQAQKDSKSSLQERNRGGKENCVSGDAAAVIWSVDMWWSNTSQNCICKWINSCYSLFC